MKTTVKIEGEINVEIPLKLFNDAIIDNLNEDQIFDILQDAVRKRTMTPRTIVERFKDDYKDEYDEIIYDAIKDLQHYKDTTIGLWAFDCDPKELLNKFNIEGEEFEQLIKDWEDFCDNNNFNEGPFFQLKDK